MIAALKDQQRERDKLVARYLEACHLLFEKGFLSHQRVNNANSPVIQNIEKGMAFFEEWCHKHDETGDHLF